MQLSHLSAVLPLWASGIHCHVTGLLRGRQLKNLDDEYSKEIYALAATATS